MGNELIADQRLKTRFHVGPLELSCDGVVVKPKLNFGLQGPAFYAVAGLRDVRGGSLAVEAFAMAYLGVESHGDCIAHFLENAKSADALPLLDVLVLALPRILGVVLEATGVDVEAASHTVSGLLVVYVGVGITAGVNLGCWPDPEGYYNLGVEGTVASGIGLGITLRAGLHRDGRAVRVTCFAGSVGFDVVCALKGDSAPAHGNELGSSTAAEAEAAPAAEGSRAPLRRGLSAHFGGWYRLARQGSALAYETVVRCASSSAMLPHAGAPEAEPLVGAPCASEGEGELQCALGTAAPCSGQQPSD